MRSRRNTRLSAVAQLGELRRRQGRQQEADKLLHQAEFVPEARVSRALLVMERGDPGASWRAIEEPLVEMPQSAQLDRAAVLPSAVVVALARVSPMRQRPPRPSCRPSRAGSAPTACSGRRPQRPGA